MSTPLTDRINALTAYSNQKTGASDTTLSDAVTRLVTGYGSGGGYEGLEYVYDDTGQNISELIWHGDGGIVSSCFNGLFTGGNKNTPISFPDHPTSVGDNAFLNSRLKIDWDTLGAELLVVGNNTFRINYTDDCSSQIVRMPKLDGLAHNGISAGASSFAYTTLKAPGTYYFDTMQNIPREFFNNLSNTNFSATFGSIGHAVQSTGQYPFHNSTAAAVATITVYTTGEYLDTIKTNLENATGSGALTFIYKASEATTYNDNSYAAGATILTSTKNS